MNKKPLLIVLGILLAVVVGVGIYLVVQSNSTPYVDPSVIDITEVNSSEEVLCPLETKICPDGNIVVRDTENGCEFYECPVDVTNTSTTTK